MDTFKRILLIFCGGILMALLAPTGQAAPSVVQSRASQTATTGTTISLSFASNTTSGNLIAVACLSSSITISTTVSASDGVNSYNPVGTNNTNASLGGVQWFYSKNISGGATTLTCTFSGASSSARSVFIYEIAGVSTITPVDVFQQSSGLSATPDSGQVNSSSASEIVVGAANCAAVCSPGSGFTGLSDGHNNEAEFKVVSVTGAQHTPFSQSSANWATSMITFTDTGALASTNVSNSFNAPQNIYADLHAKGPNPYSDVTLYGARAVNPNVPPQTAGITGSIAAGQQTATLSAASTFQNGDGVAINGAGASNTMSAPPAPSIAPSVAAGNMGTGVTVASPTGSTSYSYQIVARDQLGGLTVAGTAGTTAAGLPSLGLQTVAATAHTRSGNVVTVTTSSAHSLAVGATVYVDQNVSDFTFSGFFSVSTVPDTTHFTYVTGQDTASGASTSATGGYVNYWLCNHLTWTSVAGAFQYYVYGRVAGTMTLLGVVRPGELFWDDFGATITANQTFPDFVPTTPPVSATNDKLVTTILSGAGTTVLTLATQATNTVTAAVIKFDDAPNILAAMNNALPGAPVYFPFNGAGTYVVNSFLDTSALASVAVWQAGNILLNDTWLTRSQWSGMPAGSSALQFDWASKPMVSVNNGAYPGVYVKTSGGNILWQRLLFNANAGNGGLAFLLDGTLNGSSGFDFSFDYVSWSTGNGSNDDFLGTGLVIRGAHVVHFNKCAWNGTFSTTHPIGLYAGAFYTRGDLPPYTQGPVQWTMRNSFFTAKGAVQDNYNAGLFGVSDFQIDYAYSQGIRMPLVTSISSNSSSLGGVGHVSFWVNDTSFAPMFANLQPTKEKAFDAITAANIDSSAGQLLSGNPVPLFVVGTVSGAGLGTNTQVINGNRFSNNAVEVDGTGTFYYVLATPAAPSAVAAAGGGLPPGTYTIQITWADPNNNESAESPAASVITTTGNQSIKITPPVAPAGANGFYAYINNIKTGVGSNNCPLNPLGLPFTASLNFQNPCGQVFPIGLAGSASIGKNGLVGQRVVLSLIQFANLGSPANGTFVYCSDCTIANPCAGGGTGALAKRLNNVWVCN